MLTFQEVLTTLSNFWLSRGAMLAQPFNTEVGAGTANPATTLRVLGPEPWRVAYVEPSVRPDDSRYGENPNRLQTHTQFQVILKPDPGNPQELYLESLAALGIDLQAHDVRFVEDNWASPALGAWGLGWEVWLDGLEITQFTYFQQACSMPLDPVSVELTYGIERIVMALQGVQHFKEIQYAPGVTYGEVFGQGEYEMSKYYLDSADVTATQQMYALYVAEAENLLEARLALPAYYNILKSSHAFNVLDARGAVSTAERAQAFATMRRLSKTVAELWVEQRGELGFPLGTVTPGTVPQPLPMPSPRDARATLLFEIGVEELPAAEVSRAQDWLRDTVEDRLRATRLAFGAVSAYASPRRLVVTVSDVEAREQDGSEVVRGPRVSAAFDADGVPTRAASGFAAKHGVDPADLQRTVVGDVEHVAVVREFPGRPAAEVLSPLLGQVVRDLRADRNMRWSDPELAYVRAIRWLVAFLGDDPVPVSASLLTSGTSTRGLRDPEEPNLPVRSADGYRDFLRAHSVVVDRAERRQLIEQAASDAVEEIDGRIDVLVDNDVIDEIVDLVESPVVVLGEFDARYLELPPEILLAVMRKHQRYIPVRRSSGALSPHFVTFANGPCDVGLVAAGNAAVIRARFEDALFFWNEDLQADPAALRTQLSRLTFENRLGSMADRAERIRRNAEAIAELVGVDGDERATVQRAAELAKFDLASKMVIEMTSLAGTMAGYYARAAGETDAVAVALEEMERPRTSDADLATTIAGAILAIADRVDLLVSLYAVGVRPTGSSDPFGLRRAALGLVATLRATPRLEGLSVTALLKLGAESVAAQNIEVSAESLDAAGDFVARRFVQMLLDGGDDADLVAAVRPQTDVPARAGAVLAEIKQLRGDDRLEALVGVIQRVRRLLVKESPDASASAGSDAASNGLRSAVEKARAAGYLDGAGITQLVDASPDLVAATNNLMDAEQILHSDPAVRAARTGLLFEVLQPAPDLDWDAMSRVVART